MFCTEEPPVPHDSTHKKRAEAFCLCPAVFLFFRPQLAAASQCAALLPMEEVQDQQDAADVHVRHLRPQLMRPMAIAHRHQASPAVQSVLGLLAEFSG